MLLRLLPLPQSLMRKNQTVRQKRKTTPITAPNTITAMAMATAIPTVMTVSRGSFKETAMCCPFLNIQFQKETVCGNDFNCHPIHFHRIFLILCNNHKTFCLLEGL